MTAVSQVYNLTLSTNDLFSLFSVTRQEVVLVVLQAALDADYKYFVKQFIKYYTCLQITNVLTNLHEINDIYICIFTKACTLQHL